MSSSSNTSQGMIRIRDLEVSCIIGCLSSERECEQTLFFDLEFSTEWSAERKDSLDQTIDYVEVVDLCTDIAVKGKFQLIESLAHHLLTQILERFPTEKAKVRVRKPGAIPSALCTEVELELNRSSV